MNRIKFNRLLLSGLVTFLVFIALEIVVEYLIGYLWLGSFVAVLRNPTRVPASWGLPNQILNLSIGLVNCTLFIWLYAAFRPMFGVGPRTALIAGAFVYFFFLGFVINFGNLSFFNAGVLLPEMLYELIEIPLAIIAGAHFYEQGL